jgi:uncharacterized protein (TIGR02246 family)
MNLMLSLLPSLFVMVGQAGATDDNARSVPVGRPAADEPARSSEEKAIRAASDAFVNAYNAGDAKAIEDLFTADAESIDEDGARVLGRRAIGESFAETFAANPGGKIVVRPDSLRFLGPDVAKEEGRTTVTFAGGEEPDSDRYTVIYVKRDGRWLQSFVREHADMDLTPRERLEELGWMIGEWVDESDSAVIFTTCRWAEDTSFLIRTYTVRVQGKPALTGTQRIGWDPVAGQFRSWNFDSQGGFSEGLWSREGNRWIIKMSGPLRSGKISTETNIITHVDKDKARWKSVDRTIAGRVLPDSPEFVLVRRPPRPNE